MANHSFFAPLTIPKSNKKYEEGCSEAAPTILVSMFSKYVNLWRRVEGKNHQKNPLRIGKNV